MRPSPFKLAITLLLGLYLGSVQAEPALVIVVRHAERASEPADDPALSAAGRERAERLAEHLAHAKVGVIVTSHYRRTRETAQPLADAMGITPVEIAVGWGEVPAHITEVTAAIAALSGVVLVVGHSNTVAGIVTGLSGAPIAPLCDTSFSRVFVVNPATGVVASLHYGAADPAPADGCQ